MQRFLFLPLAVLTLFVLGVAAALVFHVSWEEMIEALSSAETRFALRLSLTTSLAAVAASAVLGLPTAYLLARRDFPGKAVVAAILELPLVMTPLVAGVGLLFLFGQNWLGGALARLGAPLVFTPWGAVAAQTFIAAPILTLTCRAAFEGVDRRYELAGQTLGLSPKQVFFRITLPLAKQGLLSGAILAWARALGEFGATLMVAGAIRFKTVTLPISVYLNLSSGEIGVSLACALLLMLAGIVLLLTLKWIGGGRNGRSLITRT